ncbi:UNVERIFIED_CONTAM: hypothetical protein Sindi_2937000 [Sesamum indicum]
MAMRKLQHTQVPIWIKLRHLPMEYWTSEGLSTVASGVGKPLYPDAITRACTRLDFARVCVMIDVNKKLTKRIVVMTPDEDGGETPCKVDVEYEWLPPKFTECMKMGHTTKECPANKPEKPTKPPVKVYVPKVNGPPPPSPEKKQRTPTVVTQNTDMGDVHVERNVSNHDDRGKAIIIYNAFDALHELDDADEIPRGTNICSPVKGGDFNAVRDLNEVCGISGDIRMVMDEFNAGTQEAGLMPLPMQGEWYTWQNCSSSTRSLWKWLDRLLINDQWLARFPMSFYHSLTPRTSNHSPLVIYGDTQQQYGGMFRFDNYLALSSDFIPSVMSIWQHEVGVPMFAVTRKLKALKPVFRAQKKKKGDLTIKVQLAKGFLEEAQNLVSSDRQNELYLYLEHCCRIVYAKAAKLEQIMLQQRAKMQWMKDGDQCSRVFFRKIAHRRVTRKILQINDENDNIHTEQGEIVHEFISYYQNLLGGTRRNVPVDIRYLRPWARHILTDEETGLLLLPFSPDDVKQTVFDIAEDKAPGPDGFSSGFFKVAWPVVGDEVTRAVLDFFATGNLLKQTNCTLLALIPKLIEQDMQFSFHWKCEPARVFQLGFADDILLFCKADINSIRVFKVGLDRFAEWAPPDKVPGSSSDSSRLTIAGCQPLLSKMDARIMGWEGLSLSYAGRVQIIKSVLSSLSLYWASAFILPKKIIKEIEKRMRNFLWKGTTTSGYAKDPWHHLGPLIERFPRGPRLLGINESTKLSYVISEGEWHWPPITDFECLEITHTLPQICGGADRVVSRFDKGQPTTQALYKLIDPPGPKVGCSSLLSGSLKIPRHAFILWLAILGKLPTTDKPWLSHSGACVLSDDGSIEIHSHLFFQCRFSRQCLTDIRKRIRFQWPNRDWETDIEWATKKWRGKHIVNIAYRSLLAACVYYIWRERNLRRFEHTERTPNTIVSTRALYRLWRIPWPIEGETN